MSNTFRRLAFGLCLLTLAACAAPTATPAPVALAFQPYIGRSLSYLVSQIDETGLLHAAAGTADKHWLQPDNMVALWALTTANAKESVGKLQASIAQYPTTRDGLIETLQHQVVTWPPQAATQVELKPGVWTETHTGPTPSADWRQSSELLLYGALNAWNAGKQDEANTLYAQALQKFDGNGFASAESGQQYATATLALAIFTGAQLQQPIADAMIERLIAQQAPTGAFYPAYSIAGPSGEPDTRTTALAALALLTVRQE